MRPKFTAAAVLAAMSISLLGAAGAAAATEFGDTCVGASPAVAPYTITTLSGPPAALPLTAPIGGVITKVKMQVGYPLPVSFPQAVKLLRPAGGNNFTVTSETMMQAGSGLTVANVRMPVQTGERLGVRGLPFTFEGSPTEGFSFFCGEGNPGVVGATLSPTPVGSTTEYPPEAEGRVPLAAVIEPDADNDGFGDESQDGCPTSAATQAPCPVVTLSTSTQVKRGSVTVIVVSNVTAPVTVKGVAKLGKGKKIKLNGGTQNLVPGTISKFRLFFTKGLKNKLKELPPKRSLRLNVTASGTSVSGAVTTKTLKIKLKGQAKD